MLQSYKGLFDFASEFRTTGALNKVVVVFKFASARAALGLFITSIAVHPAACREFTHTVLMCPGLIIFTMFSVHWYEYLPVNIINKEVLDRPVIVVEVVVAEGW